MLLALLAAACGNSSSSSTTTTAISPASSVAAAHGGARKLATQRFSRVGSVLTNGNGRTLYVFMPEKGGKVACTGGCASVWPPLLLARQKPTATSPVHPNLLGTVADPTGGTIVTYAGWPLHTYAPDTGPGTAKGQGVGGKWYVISPSGQVITQPIGTSSTGSGSGGSAY